MCLERGYMNTFLGCYFEIRNICNLKLQRNPCLKYPKLILMTLKVNKPTTD